MPVGPVSVSGVDMKIQKMPQKIALFTLLTGTLPKEQTEIPTPTPL